MMKFKHPFRAIWILVLSQSVPIAACSRDDTEDEDDFRNVDECQSSVACGAARFNFSDALAPGEYALRLGLPDDEIDCTVSVAEEGSITNDCDLELDRESLEVDRGGEPVTLSITDESGCSAEVAIISGDYTSEVIGCDVDCQGAEKTLDLSECAADWDQDARVPECEIGYDWSERCDDPGSFPSVSRQILEGCGYTWVKGIYLDAWRNTIVDADGIVVFQQVYDSSSRGSSCLGGTIPDCADLPDVAGGRWPDESIETQGNECLDEGMGGAGGGGGAGGAAN